MSMNGEYLRVTPDELARAIDDPDWALAFAQAVQGDEGQAELPPDQARYLTTDKAWAAIDFLLDRAGFPVEIVHGEEVFGEEEDWGYGPPSYLTPERVRVAAGALAATSYEALTAGVDRVALAKAGIEPRVWDEPDSMEWVRGWYEPLAPFFAGAARQGQAVLIWLD